MAEHINWMIIRQSTEIQDTPPTIHHKHIGTVEIAKNELYLYDEIDKIGVIWRSYSKLCRMRWLPNLPNPN